MTSVLVIPDPHAHPDHNNDRFEKLGQLAADLNPTHIVCMGDWGCMPSLSSYDKGTRGFEGKRYHLDVASVIDAQEKFFKPLDTSRNRSKLWMLEGNHEYRIKRAIEANASQLEGIISLADLQYKEFGWETIEYNGSTPGILELDGVAYAHYFTSGVMGRPISGMHPAYSLLTKQYQSCTQAHIHTLDFCIRTNASGRNIQGLVAGCAIDYFANWAGEANNLWWSGCILKDHVEQGQYDPTFISLDKL